MKQNLLLALLAVTALFSCSQTKTTDASRSIEGTWQLLAGTLIEKGDSTITRYTHDTSFIKIINDSHFAFFGHDLKKGKDSTALFFSSGGGRYDLSDSNYTEHLEYCGDRQWEGNDFHFVIHLTGDTLTIRGEEKVEGTNINRLNIEKYVRLKNASLTEQNEK